MTNVAFVAPFFMEATLRFVEAAIALPGVRLGLVSQDPLERLPKAVAGRLAAHWRVDDALDPGKVADGVRMLVVPGSAKVRLQAESEGLDKVFTEAGAEWRLPGCSMCLGMNPDTLAPGERSASTSNRNFEGRQGRGGRTHLMSPPMAAAAAVAGRIVDVRRWGREPGAS